MKLYLDADIFLALIKESDRFKKSAIDFFPKSVHNELITSTLTCMEIWFYLHKNNLKEKSLDAIRSISSVCTIVGYDLADIENSIVLGEHHKLTPADSVHASLAMKTGCIVSTDSSFDRVPGLKRIDFSK